MKGTEMKMASYIWSMPRRTSMADDVHRSAIVEYHLIITNSAITLEFDQTPSANIYPNRIALTSSSVLY